MPDVYVNVPLNQEIESVPAIGYAPIYFPPEGAKAVFEFTEETFLKVYSALRNGAQITYPDEWLQVLWYFQQNVEFPVSLCDEIANAIIDCSDVQDAIASLVEQDGVVRDSIVSLVTSDPAINTYITNVFRRLTPEVVGGKLVGGDCDNGVVAGRALAIVEALDTNNTDALEILEIGTNDEERLAGIFSAFPAFGLLPLDELLDFAQDVLEDFGENYAAASTTERKEAFARLIWCKMLESEDCSITWQQMFDIVLGQVPSAPFDILVTIGDIVQFVGDGDFGDDDLLFYGMMLLNLSTITAASNFNGITAPKLGAIMRDASPSSVWETWDACDPVPPDPDCVDLTVSPENWVFPTAYGSWSDGTGLAPLPDSPFLFYASHVQYDVVRNVSGLDLYFNNPTDDIYVFNAHGTFHYTGDAVTTLVLNPTTAPILFSSGVFNAGAGGTQVGVTFQPDNAAPSAAWRMIASCFHDAP